MKSVVFLKKTLSHCGGLEKWARALLSTFLERGCRVILLTNDEPIDIPQDVEVYRLHKSYPMSFIQLLAFDRFCQRFLKTFAADCIFGLDRNSFQTHLRIGNGVHRMYLQRRKIAEDRFSSIRHTLNPLHRILLGLEKKAFEHPNLKKLFTNSEMVRQEVLQFYAVDPNKITVIHNGVEWESFALDFANWSEKYPRNSNEFHLLFVGHGFRRKGLSRLLHGLSRLKRQDLHLSVVGGDKELTYFMQIAEKLKVRATFYGAQGDIRPFYQKADALVIPSYYDPFANVTIEALAFGLFVVSSKYNGGSEILTRDTGCIIEDLDDDASIAEALEKMSAHPKTISSANRIRSSVRHLNISTQLQRFVELTLEC